MATSPRNNVSLADAERAMDSARTHDQQAAGRLDVRKRGRRGVKVLKRKGKRHHLIVKHSFAPATSSLAAQASPQSRLRPRRVIHAQRRRSFSRSPTKRTDSRPAPYAHQLPRGVMQNLLMGLFDAPFGKGSRAISTCDEKWQGLGHIRAAPPMQNKSSLRCRRPHRPHPSSRGSIDSTRFRRQRVSLSSPLRVSCPYHHLHTTPAPPSALYRQLHLHPAFRSPRGRTDRLHPISIRVLALRQYFGPAHPPGPQSKRWICCHSA
ncbi:hypothetical protein K438DRAFT_1188113 [Mycena galopus ATCC 62051]|nr:hypothetical protein K438DRAFT_1188113 [Mycena galopus ATCC 62051]